MVEAYGLSAIHACVGFTAGALGGSIYISGSGGDAGWDVVSARVRTVGVGTIKWCLIGEFVKEHGIIGDEFQRER